MTGWALQAMPMDPLSQYPSTQTPPVGTSGYVSTDGVKSSGCEFYFCWTHFLEFIVKSQQFSCSIPHPRNMVIFRNVVNGQPLSNWWDNGNSQIAFSRGSKGFIVINNDDW